MDQNHRNATQSDLTKSEQLFQELGEIHDAYMIDVRQFIGFMKERRLELVEGFREYAEWLEQEHDGKIYSSATINRKISAAKSRVRYAFKHSSSAELLRTQYQLEEVLREVKLKPVGPLVVSPDKVLSIEEVRHLIGETADSTIKLMVRFLVGTGVRISEMLSVRLSDLQAADKDFVSVRVVGKRDKERVIHVNVKLMDRIRRYFHGTTYLFEHHGRPYNRISVTNRIKLESLKTIRREVTAKQLRHTWAVIQIRRGKAVSAVAAALGHADSGLTARMYSDETLDPQEAFLDLQDPERAASAEGNE